MNKLHLLAGLMAISVLAGCGSSDIVCTSGLKELLHKCIYIEPLKSENPHVGDVLRDVLEKEFVRKKIEICDANTATIFVSGSTFMTVRTRAETGFLGAPKYIAENQSIESVSIIATDKSGQILLSASYDNKDQHTVSKLGKEFGSALANKLK